MSDSRTVINHNLGEKSGELGSEHRLMPANYTPYRALEARIVFDGAGAATVAEATQSTPDAPAGDAPADGTADGAASDVQDLVAALSSGGPAAVPDTGGATGSSSGAQIVFIDGAVNDPGVLAGAVPAGAEIVMLDGGSDGLTQIALYLDGRSGIDAIHIVSHGEQGELKLGNAVVDSHSISGAHADEIAIIRSALTDHADIALYGCNVAAGSEGLAFLEALSNATGADIAASTDDTGAADLGGDWDLETRTSLIEAGLIDAPDWDGLLAPFQISVSVLPTLFNANGVSPTGFASGGVGFIGIWTNAGTVGGVPVDLVAEVISAAPGTSVSFWNQLDDPNVELFGTNTVAEAVVEWRVFQSGTGQTVATTGDVGFFITDIDGLGGVPFSIESVRADLTGLNSYSVETGSTLTIVNDGSSLTGSGTQPFGPYSTIPSIKFQWSGVSSWRVTYREDNAPTYGARYFRHDADGDLTFIAPIVTGLPQLDLDGNNSSGATGNNYTTNYTENGAGVTIADTDIAITHASSTTISGATITLTNAQAGDLLAAGTLPGGITATSYNSATGVLTLSGSTTLANYQTAINNITFANSTNSPSTVDRSITVRITDGVNASDIATTTIQVTAVNDVPTDGDETNSVTEDTTLTVPAATGLLANAADLDGDTLSITGYTIAGISGTQPVGSGVLISGVGTITINANGSYSFAPAANYSGTIPVVTYTVSDGASGTDTSTLALTMVAVNDPPQGTDKIISTAEEAPHTFTAADFGFTDPLDSPAHNFKQVIITTLPPIGILTLGGIPVSAGQIIPQGAIGTLVWTPPVDAFGVALSSFTFQVVDDGGTNANLIVNGSLENTAFAAPSTVIPDYNSTTPPTAADINPAGLTGWSRVITQYTSGASTNYFLAGMNLERNDDPVTTDTPYGTQFAQYAQVYQTISGLTPGATYVVSGDAIINSPNASTTSLFQLDVYDSATFNGTLNYDIALPTTIASGSIDSAVDGSNPAWRNLSFTVVVPASGSISLMVTKQATTVAVCNWDNISLTRQGGGADTDLSPNTITFNVSNVNDLPVDGNETNSVIEDTTLTVPVATGLLANTVDPDGATATITGYAIAGIGGTQVIGVPVLIPGTGTITINADGSYSFAPVANYAGAVPVITYTVSDGTATDTSTLTLSMVPVNDAPIVDLNSAATTADVTRGNAVTFNENGAAVNIAVAGLADVSDAGEADITLFNITLGGFTDGSQEIVQVAGHDFPADQDQTVTGLSVGGSFVNIAYVATTGVFTVTNATGASNPIPEADLDLLVRGTTYINTSLNPAGGDRTVTFSATDATGATSADAVSTITVAIFNDAPSVAITVINPGDVIVVDLSIANAQALIDALPAGTSIITIPQGVDGIYYLAGQLAGRHDITALHILSHGEVGELHLGTAVLTSMNAQTAYGSSLALIGASLSSNADILVYGCNIGQDALLIQKLADTTSADVAASTDNTGHTTLGGNWTLEEFAGPIETAALAPLAWEGLLAPVNTGTWTFAGSTASNVVSGVTTTISFTANSANSSFTSISNQTFNTIAAFSSSTVQGAASLGAVFNWDTSPEAVTGIPQPLAVTDGGTGTVTITFSQAVTNPIINIDRLGGNSSFDPNILIPGDENSLSNSSLWTVTTAGATLTKLTGVTHLDVTSTTFQRTPNATMATSGTSSESGTNGTLNTAAGSIRVNGTFTSITFQLSGSGVEGGGADGFEIGVRFDPVNQPPAVVTPSYTTPEDTPKVLTGISFSDPDASTGNVTVTISVPTGTLDLNTAVAGGVTAAQVTGDLSGTITITASLSAINATLANATGLTYAPPADFNGTVVLTSTIDDLGNTGQGGAMTASTTANIVVTPVNDAPIIDLNSAGTAADANRGNTVTFTENGAQINVASSTLADVNDIGENDITSLSIATGNMTDGAADVVSIGGATFPLNANSTQTVTVGGTTFSVAYTTAGGFAITKSGGGVIPQADLDTLVRGITYQNTSEAPTASNRTLTFTATDSGGLSSAAAVSTITVVAVNDAPVAPDCLDEAPAEFGTATYNSLTVFAVSAAAVKPGEYAVYTNIGTFDGQPLDLKITFVSTTGASTGSIRFFSGSSMSILAQGYAAGVENNLKFEYFLSGTSTPAPFSGVLNFSDIDDIDQTGPTVPEAVTLPTGVFQNLLFTATTTLTASTSGGLTTIAGTRESGAYSGAGGNLSDLAFTSTIENTSSFAMILRNGGTNTGFTINSNNFTFIPGADCTNMDAGVTNEDTPLVVPVASGLLSNDTDADGDTLVVSQVQGQAANVGQAVTLASGAIVTVNANGFYTYNPNGAYEALTAGATATDSFQYQVSDGKGGFDLGTVTITINGVNDAPVDGNETNSVTEDTTLTVPVATGLLANTIDPDGATATITGYSIAGISGTQAIGAPVVIPGTGTLTINADGSYSFAPAANYAGAVPVITYTISDGNGGADTSTLTLSMVPVNDAPVDDNETNSVTEDTTLTVPVATGLLANTVDPDGAAATITGYSIAGISGTQAIGVPVLIPGVGTLTINADGSYAFAPVANYTGVVPVITYTVSDGTATDTSTLTLSMVPVNDAPVDGNETNSVTEDTTLTVPVATGLLANTVDPDGAAATITGYSIAGISGTQAIGVPVLIPGVGTLTINADGSYAFAPVANYAGLIPVITYTVSDGTATDTSTLTLSMVPVNDAPVDGNETNSVTEDTTLTVPVATGLLANTVDPDGATATITGYTIAGISGTQVIGVPVLIPGVGTLTINADGSYAFAPVANYAGVVPVITYTVSDGTATDTSTLTLSMVPVNDAPVATADSGSGPEDTPVVIDVLANDSDVEGALDPTSVIINSTPAGATLSPDGKTLTVPGQGVWSVNTTTGAITFTPAADYNGTPTPITYRVFDTAGSPSNTVLVSITITPANDAPIVDLNSAATAADTNRDNPTTYTEGDAPLIVAPSADVSDLGENDISSVKIAIAGILDGAFEVISIGGVSFNPIVTSSAIVTIGGTDFQITYTAGSGGTGTFNISQVGGGAIPQADLDLLVRSVTYQNTDQDPASGDRTLTFTVKDTSNITSSPAVATITVVPVNDAPIADDESFVTDEDTASVAIALLPGDTDVDGGTLFVQSINGTALTPGFAQAISVTNGTVNVSAAGVVTFTPALNYNGPVSFDYVVADGNGGTDTGAVTGTVNPVNDPPALDLDSNPALVNLIVNGDFETDTLAGWTSAYGLGNGSVVSQVVHPDASFATVTTFDHTEAAPTGNLVQIDTGFPVGFTGSLLAQTVTLVAGQTYTVSMWATPYYPANAPIMSMEINGTPVVTQTLNLSQTGTWQLITGTFTAPADGSYTLTIRDLNPTGGGNDVLIDDVSITYLADATTGYETTFTEDGPAVAIADIDSAVTDADDTNIESAVIVLTNAQAGDVMSFAGALPAGITANIDTSVAGQVTITLTGSATKADYEAALEAIRFENTSNTPDTTDRNITVTVNDGELNSNTALATIHVVPVNDAPVAVDDTGSVSEDGPVATGNVITGAGTDTDAEGDTLAVTLAGQAGNPITLGTPFTVAGGGTLTLNSDGSYTFEPGTAYNGLDVGETATETISYTISDGNGGTDTALLVITINGANDTPVVIDPANPGTATNPIQATDPLNIIPDVATTDGAALTPINVGTYVVDPDGEPLTFTLDPAVPAWIIIDPVTGVITGTPPADASQGSNTGNPGEYLITITATDPDGALVTTTVTLTIVNLPPVAVADAASVGEDTVSVTGNVLTDPTTGDADTAPDSDPLTVTLADQAGNPITLGTPFTVAGGGTLTLNADGSYTFNPGTAYNGLDAGETATETIEYTISDGNGGTDTALLVITVQGANDTPVVIDPANPGTATNPIQATDPLNIIPDVATTDGAALTPINVGTYVVDPDGEPLTFTLDPAVPAWIIIDPVTGVITGTPPADASQGSNTGNPGEYLITITATDPDGALVTTTVTLTIVNLPPVAVADAASVGEDTVSVTGNVLTDPTTGDADTAPDSDPLTVTLADQTGNPITLGTPFTVAGGGTLTLNADGSYIFNPGTAYNGLDAGETATETITYTVSDGNGGTATATLVITINGANDAPVVIDPANPGTATNPIQATDPLNIIPDVATTDGAALTPINVGTYVVDPDGEPLTFTLDPAVPAWIIIDPVTGVITGTPPANASQLTNTGNPGEYLITVTATDPDGALVTTTVTLTIVNLPPVAVDDAASVGEDTVSVTGNVLTDPTTGDLDTAPDSDPLTVTLANQGGNPITLGTPFTVAGGGTLTLNADGSYTFNPGTAYNGLDAGETATETIEYTISDGNGGTDTALLVITVQGANDAPVVIDPANPGTPSNPIQATDPLNIIPDVATTDGAALTPINVGTYIVDPDGEPLTFTLDPSVPAWVVIDPVTGNITGTPPADASQLTNTGNPGEYLLTITATDPDGALVTTTVTLTIVNLPPVAVDDTASVGEDTVSVTGNVLTDPTTGDADTAPDSDPLTVTLANQAGNVIAIGTPFTVAGGGTLTLNSDGSYTFEPGTAYNGLDVGETATETISYTISDGNGGTDTALLVITINGANDTPVVIDPANPGTATNPIQATDPLNIIPDVATTDGAALTPINVGTYVVDPDGEPLTFTLDPAVPAWIIIDPVTGVITGTPPADASQGSNTGNPGEYLITITATDPDGALVTTTVTLSIVNLPPVAVDDTGAVSEDGPAITGNAIADALTGDADTAPDSDPLSVVAIGGDASLVGQPVAGSTGGTFTLLADGSWSFDPGADFDNLAVGETRDTVITYRVADGQGGTAEATITVTVNGANDAPVALGPIAPVMATDSVAITPIDTSVAFANPNNIPLVYTAGNLPEGLTIDPATGIITGTPASDASVQGPYIVTVTAAGPNGETATVALQIDVANPAPIAADDIATTPVDTPVTLAPLANDSDVDGDPLTITAITPPANGSATLNPDGTITYTPDAGFTGTETITYTVSDGQGGTTAATITIIVGAPPADAPVVTGSIPNQTGTDDQPITPINAGGLFSDPTGPLEFSATGLPSGLTIDPVTGLITGTIEPDASVDGPYSVTVTAVDPDGNQVSTTFVLGVLNPAPAAANDATSTPLDTPVVIGVLGNDSDPDGDALIVSYASDPANGTVSINPDGSITYTPDAGFTGTDTFSYTVADGEGGTSIATVTVSVGAPLPGAPVLSGPVAPVTGVDGAPIAPIDLGTLITDPTGQPLTFTATGLPEGLAIDPVTGIITGTFEPDASSEGPFTVTVTAVDPDGNQITTTLVLTATNPGPVAGNDIATTPADQPVVIGVLGNDGDPDGDVITVTAVTDPVHGTVVINPNGTITYTPDAGFTGTETFTYTITDADGASVTATVTVNTGVPGPLAATPAIAPTIGTDGATITPVVVGKAFGDPDQTGPLTLSVDLTALPPGIAFDPATGTFSGTPTNNASQGSTPGEPAGTYIVPVTATDSNGATTTTYVTFTIANLPPVAVNDTASTREGFGVQIDVLKNDHDTAPDSDPLTVVLATAANGTVVINPDGTLSYTPRAGFAGTDVITYTISDGNGGTSIATVKVSVAAQGYVPSPGTPTGPIFSTGSGAPPPSLHVSGAIVSSANGGDVGFESSALQGADFIYIASQTLAHGAIMSAAHQFDPLNGTNSMTESLSLAGLPSLSGTNSILGTEIDRLNGFWGSLLASTESGAGGDGTWGPEGMTGFSLRYGAPGSLGGSAESEVIVVESLVRQRTLMINAQALGPVAGKAITEFRFVQANGKPLPSWLDEARDGFLIGERPVNVERIEIRVIAVLQDGTTIEKDIVIDTVAGDVKPLASGQRTELPPMFSKQFAAAPKLNEFEIEALARVLTSVAA